MNGCFPDDVYRLLGGGLVWTGHPFRGHGPDVVEVQGPVRVLIVRHIGPEVGGKLYIYAWIRLHLWAGVYQMQVHHFFPHHDLRLFFPFVHCFRAPFFFQFLFFFHFYPHP